MTQSAFVSGAQDHAGRLARLECFLPTRSTEAPAVAGFQAAKAEFRHRCRKIVAAGFGKLEKRRGHDGADRVAADVLSPRIAAAVAKEPRHGIHRAHFEPVTEHIARCVRPTASVPAVVPQHGRLRARMNLFRDAPETATRPHPRAFYIWPGRCAIACHAPASFAVRSKLAAQLASGADTKSSTTPPKSSK